MLLNKEVDAATTQARTADATKRRIVGAALATLRTEGYAGTSARSIARAGGFNQALIFYHFGSLDRLLLAALDESSASRMARYESQTRDVSSIEELVGVARRLYLEDLEAGHITIVSEMIAAGLSRPELRGEVLARMDPWLSFCERLIVRFLEPTGVLGLAPARQIAAAVIAFYLGFNTLTHLGSEVSRSADLFASAERFASLLPTMTDGGA